MSENKKEISIHCAYDNIVEKDKLIPHPKNPNVHPKNQIELLSKIIRYQGWRVPITVSKRSGFIVRGHGRLEACNFGNIEMIPIDYQDYNSEAEEYADMVADNRLSELSNFNKENLDNVLGEISQFDIDFELTGFNEDYFQEVPLNEEIDQVFGIYIECGSESEQSELLNRFNEEGLKCRSLIS